MSIARTSDQWWKNAVIYCLDVETFLDWNDDGIGDIDGLAERVDYLAGIGVSCLWLMPSIPHRTGMTGTTSATTTAWITALEPLEGSWR